VDYLKDNFRQNYVTLTAGNGEEALAIMKEHRVESSRREVDVSTSCAGNSRSFSVKAAISAGSVTLN